MRLGHLLALYGGGLFVLSFLDSSFFPFPGFNDLALIVLASQHPARAPFYALLSIFGSLSGCYVMYWIARGGGRLAFRRPASTRWHAARRWLERNDFVAMLVMALLPPPAPLKVFVIAAGALRTNALRFGTALLLGRSLRFAAIAWLGAHYGRQAEAFLKQNLTWASLVSIVLVIVLTLLVRWWKSRRPADTDTPGSPGAS